jgi:hypothetical protein
MTIDPWLTAYLLITLPCVALCVRDAVRYYRRKHHR